MNDARDYASFFLNLSRTGGDVVSFHAGGPAFLVNSPELAQTVLATNERAYENPYHPHKELGGQYEPPGGLLLGTLARNGHAAAIALNSILSEEARLAVEAWLASGEVQIDVAAKVLTLRSVTRALFGLTVDDGEDFVRATDVVEECYVNQAAAPAAAMETQSALIDRIAVHCSLTGRDGFISNETRTAILRTLLNGYNATGTSLAWTLYLLAQHGGLRDLRLAILESLRLYPPAWNLGRSALAEHHLGDTLIPRDARIFISPYAMQRHPAWWDRPSEFVPERFAKPPRHPFAYFPFGGGSRRCPAGHLMTQHLKTIVDVIATRARWGLASPPVRPRGLVALRPSSEIVLRFYNPAPCADSSLF
ncbi:MAG TPA: cytochrome P450 [Thermoanaerobaculia bacterium]|nr:cytochrome P450 [Thermoanaerobaculia bacterium]